jgi:hypothetical protein
VFDSSFQASGPIFAKDRSNDLGGMRSLINGDAIIRLTNADAEEEGGETFVVHFPASTFHGCKNLQIDGFGGGDKEVIRGSTEKDRRTINGASVKARIGAVGLETQAMISVHQNLFDEFLPFAGCVDTALNHFEHFERKHVSRLFLDKGVNFGPQIGVTFLEPHETFRETTQPNAFAVDEWSGSALESIGDVHVPQGQA